MDAREAVPIPANLSWEQAASIPLTFDRSQAPRGFTVFVDVSVGAGAAVCRTSFTTQ